MRILLWEIDGTILRSERPSTFHEYMRRLLKAVFGTAGQIDDPPLTGIADVQYIAEALSSEGFTRSDIWESLPETSNRDLCEY